MCVARRSAHLVAVWHGAGSVAAVLGARVLAEFGDDKTRYATAKARKNLDPFRYGEGVGGAGTEAAPPPCASDLRLEAVECRWTPVSDDFRVNMVRSRP